jgi:hypothetical protein
MQRTAVPERADDAAVDAYVDEYLDSMWDSMGLPGDRPERRPTIVSVEEYNENQQACGYPWSEPGVVTGSDGRILLDPEDTGLVSLLSDYYDCSTETMQDPRMAGIVFSDAERAYLYDYFQDWLVPCLTDRGVVVGDVPTREAFLDQQQYGWNPYWTTAGYETWEDYLSLVEVCGHAFGILDVYDGTEQ